MREARDHILQYADMLERKHMKRKVKVVIVAPTKADMHVTLSRMKDLMTVKEAVSIGLLLGNLASLNRRAAAMELKAIKIPGSREWHVLPEWIEEYNNRWAILNRHVR